MSNFCPHYPRPATRKPSPWSMFFSKRRSWLDSLYERSYSMKMGEVHLPGVDLFMVNEPELVRRVMVEASEEFPKHAMLGDALRPLLGDSIFTTNGEVWRRQRELMNPSFEAARLKLVFGRMHEAAQAMVRRMSELPDGTVQDLEVEMTHVAADIILRTILSESLDSAGARRIFEAFARYQALAPRLMMPAFFGLRWLRPWWQVRHSRRAAAEIRELLVALIRPRFDAHQRAREEGAGSEPAEGDDILATLLRVQADAGGGGFGFDELVDQVAMLFLAGHETSASALSWALHLLAHSPDVQERLHEEAVTALAAVDSEGSSCIRALPLARNVFRETLRLFPPVGFLARQSARACTMRGKAVPVGASVVVSPWLIHRHRTLWPSPDEFDPDRFDASDADAASGNKQAIRSAYLPFGLGPRVCIGAAFAQQEAALILGMVALHFRLVPVAGFVPEPVGRLTIRAENGIHLQVFSRSGA